MKLAEALAERKTAQDKIAELNTRLQRVAIVQQGDTPAEDPAALLRELDETAQRLEYLIRAINRTNLQAELPDTRSMTDALAHRDVLKLEIGVYEALLQTIGGQQFRRRSSEIKFMPTVDAAVVQRTRDHLSRQYRELDVAIQATNWTTDLQE